MTGNGVEQSIGGEQGTAGLLSNPIHSPISVKGKLEPDRCPPYGSSRWTQAKCGPRIDPDCLTQQPADIAGC